MSTTVNPTNKPKLTTKTLGIADSKEKDLAGYILSPRDIKNATTKILIAAGLNPEDIRTIRVGSDKSKNLRIICEVKYGAAFKREEKRNGIWFSLNPDVDYNDRGAFNETFYAALHNKVYHGKRKHLNIRVINREVSVKKKDKEKEKEMKKFVTFEFDAKILIAFVYDIVFTDPFYKISVAKKRWPDNFDNMTGKERDKIKKERKEMAADGLMNCTIFVTYCSRAKWKKYDNNGEAQIYTGFHPGEVDDFFGE